MKKLTEYLNTAATQKIESRHGAYLNRLSRVDLISLAENLEDTYRAFNSITYSFLVEIFDDYEFEGEGRAIALDICQIVGSNLSQSDKIDRVTLMAIARCARDYAETR